jgi:hypothetical protein
MQSIQDNPQQKPAVVIVAADSYGRPVRVLRIIREDDAPLSDEFWRFLMGRKAAC